MSQTECLQALGVTANASWPEVRQAYLDLVRVWHPDRFQGDPNLRDRAAQHLKRINEAYDTLKKSHLFYTAEPEPAPEPEPEPARQAAPVRPRPSRGRFLPDLRFGWLLKLAGLGLLCLGPLAFAGLLFNAARVPSLDSMLSQNGMIRPSILMPSQAIDPFAGRSAAIDALSAWSHKAKDLWSAIPKFGKSSPDPQVDAAPYTSQPKDDVAARAEPHHRAIPSAAAAVPVNGTELLWTHRSGAGEVWVTNDTGHDALATLVPSQSTAPLRAIYIQAKNRVCMRNIAPGVYDLLAEVGENWDASHVRFRAERQTLDRSGPLVCVDVTSDEGRSGCKYDVTLRSR
jgi:hypothetical protein